MIPSTERREMKTRAGDVIIWHKREEVSLRLVAVVLNDDEEPEDITSWRPAGRQRANAMARATVQGTGGRVLLWDGGELRSEE
jgi:hypothetical protein